MRLPLPALRNAALAAGLALAAAATPAQPVPAAVAATPGAPAGLPASIVPPADLERGLQLLHAAASATAPPLARVIVEAGPADARLRLAPCQRVEPFLTPGHAAWGRTRLGLRCAQGSVAWTIYHPVTVQVLAPALGLRQALPAGHVLRAEDLLTVHANWAASAERPLASTGELLGRTLARPVQPGEALRRADLRRRQWFASGERVTVLASGPGFSVSSEGVALADGVEGQRVSVQMQPRGADAGMPVRQVVVQAMPVGERKVEVPLR